MLRNCKTSMIYDKAICPKLFQWAIFLGPEKGKIRSAGPRSCTLSEGFCKIGTRFRFVAMNELPACFRQFIQMFVQLSGKNLQQRNNCD